MSARRSANSAAGACITVRFICAAAVHGMCTGAGSRWVHKQAAEHIVLVTVGLAVAGETPPPQGIQYANQAGTCMLRC
jgi:hypothetical protein